MMDLKVYTIDIYYGDKLIDTIEIEAVSEYHAILEAKDVFCFSIKGVARK